MAIKGFLLKYPTGYTDVEKNLVTTQQLKETADELDQKNTNTSYFDLLVSDQKMNELLESVNEAVPGLQLESLEDLIEELDNEQVQAALKELDVDPRFLIFVQGYKTALKNKADLHDYTDDDVDNPTVVKDQAQALYWINA